MFKKDYIETNCITSLQLRLKRSLHYYTFNTGNMKHNFKFIYRNILIVCKNVFNLIYYILLSPFNGKCCNEFSTSGTCFYILYYAWR